MIELGYIFVLFYFKKKFCFDLYSLPHQKKSFFWLIATTWKIDKQNEF
jgi:hypothetical protein